MIVIIHAHDVKLIDPHNNNNNNNNNNSTNHNNCYYYCYIMHAYVPQLIFTHIHQ